MKRILPLFTLVFTLCSCEPTPIKEGRDAYLEYFNKKMKDPSSLIVHGEEIIEQSNVSVTFIVDIGAKNSFGGYVRKSYTIKTVGNKVLKVIDYDIRKYKEVQPEKKNTPFTYKQKNVPMFGFSPEDYIGKEIELKDSCVYSLSDMEQFFNEDIEKAKNGDASYILPKGEKVKIISAKDNYFAIEGRYGMTYYIEQSSIF